MFKISMKEFLDWETKSWHGGDNNRDNFDYRYGQKFINDHARKGLIVTDTKTFYTENKAECRELIIEKYVNKEW